MSAFPNSPRLLKGGLVLLDPVTSAVRRVVALQYNADQLSRTLTAQGVGESADRSEALRLKGPPVETIRLDAEIDATDQLEFPDQNAETAALGLHPALAAIETAIYPASSDMTANDNLANAGTLEILPMQAALTLFVWSKSRVLPVRLTDLSITEEAFDANLNPIRAKVGLSMRVLSVSDLGFASKGGSLFMTYQQSRERLAAAYRGGSFGTLGLEGAP